MFNRRLGLALEKAVRENISFGVGGECNSQSWYVNEVGRSKACFYFHSQFFTLAVSSLMEEGDD